jgi:lysophospholipase L1-like esterase
MWRIALDSSEEERPGYPSGVFADEAAQITREIPLMIRSFLITLAIVLVASVMVVPSWESIVGDGSAYDDCQTHFTVVVLGSSTASGAGATPITMAWVPRYRTYLQQISASNQVINRAVGGYSTYNVMPTGTVPPANRPVPDPTHNITYAISLKPNAIIVSLPTNDVALGYSMAEITANFKTIAATARAARIPLWVTTPQPRNLSVNQRAKLAQLRDFINQTFGANALDFMSGLGTPDGNLLPMYTDDRTHPNNLGHALLFRRVVAASIPEIVCASRVASGQQKSVRMASTAQLPATRPQ